MGMSIPIKVYIIPNIVMVWEGFLYILSCHSFKGVPDNIQIDYQPIVPNNIKENIDLRTNFYSKMSKIFG